MTRLTDARVQKEKGKGAKAHLLGGRRLAARDHLADRRLATLEVGAALVADEDQLDLNVLRSRENRGEFQRSAFLWQMDFGSVEANANAKNGRRPPLNAAPAYAMVLSQQRRHTPAP